MSDRSWAEGLTQEQFVHEYLQRFPFADVIPNVKEWAYQSDPVYRTIDPINAEDYRNDEIPTPEKKERVKIYACRGCGRVFNVQIARAGHERACKAIVRKEQ